MLVDAGEDLLFFFFQAEDGIRDHCVTGVQTCALPISPFVSVTAGAGPRRLVLGPSDKFLYVNHQDDSKVSVFEIGRASCRERSGDSGGGRVSKKKKEHKYDEANWTKGSIADGRTGN